MLLELRSLRALLILRVSDGNAVVDACGDVCVVCVPSIGGCLGSEEYRTGGTSQCARKCSPRTELYGLHTLPCCTYKRQSTHLCDHMTVVTYNELEVFGKRKPHRSKHTLKGIIRIVNATTGVTLAE